MIRELIPLYLLTVMQVPCERATLIPGASPQALIDGDCARANKEETYAEAEPARVAAFRRLGMQTWPRCCLVQTATSGAPDTHRGNRQLTS